MVAAFGAMEPVTSGSSSQGPTSREEKLQRRHGQGEGRPPAIFMASLGKSVSSITARIGLHGASGSGKRISHRSRDKALNALTTGDFTEADEPFALFAAWMDEARPRSRTIPTPWRWRPSTPTVCRMCAWCC